MAVVTGELIRAMNYVEDMTTTLRRICIYIPNMSPEERKRLAESLRAAGVAINAAVADLEIHDGNLGDGWRGSHARTVAAPIRGVKHQPCLELRFSLA